MHGETVKNMQNRLTVTNHWCSCFLSKSVKFKLCNYILFWRKQQTQFLKLCVSSWKSF